MANFFMKIWGKSKVEVKSLNQARHINKICNEGGVLFNIKKVDIDKLEFLAYSKNRKKIKKEFSSAKEFSITAKTGFLNFCGFLKKQMVVLLCFLLGICATFVANGFVWKVEVVSKDAGTQSAVLAFLKEENILSKKPKTSYNTLQIKQKILEKFNNIALCDVLIKGQTLVVNAQEKSFAVSQGFNLSPVVCDFDCVIKKINVTSGTAKVKQGDIATKGTILVEPYILRAGKFEACEVVCEIEVEGEVNEVKTVYERFNDKRRTGNKVIKNYFTFNNSFAKIKQGKVKFENYETEIVCENKNVFPIIPVRLTSIAYFEIEEFENKIDFLANQQNFEEKFKLEILAKLGEVQIKNEQIQSQKIDEEVFEINYFVAFTKTLKQG